MKKIGIAAAAASIAALVALGARRRDALLRRFRGRPSGVSDMPAIYDDATLKAKVETELFRPEDAPKGSVLVNAQYGVVQLRGELESQDLIDDLVSRARGIDGVNNVENLLHLPGTEAPMHN
jgi:osmotically-inducible protein OsmY